MSTLLKEGCVLTDLAAENKDQVIHTMAQALMETGKIKTLDGFCASVFEREAITPTYLGFDMGLPHGKTDEVMESGICFCRLNAPVIWDEGTGDTVRLVIMVAVPEGEGGNTHLDILAKLSRNLMHESFREQLNTGDASTVYSFLKTALEEKENA